MMPMLRCPRCGEKPRAFWYDWDNGPGEWRVECHGPDCCDSSGATQEAAIEEWNKQPYILALTREIMILRSKLSYIETLLEGDII